MSEENTKPTGPDFAKGIPTADLADGGMILGQVAGEAVLLARAGGARFAIGAECTHYHGPLAEGVLVADTVRCPWHHACFSLRTGDALRAPALNPVTCWRVEQRDGTIYVREKLEPAVRAARTAAQAGPESIVIIGGGAAGNAAAEILRREGYAGRVTMLTADEAGPYDRPNLSKDYLAGTALEEWIPLRSPEFYAEHAIELKLGTRAAGIDLKTREVRLADGSRHHYGALLLATGAVPVRLDIPGGNLPHIHYLRTLADSRALIAAANAARRAVVIGASFIGLEVAASLRARGLEVHVVAPEARPMENVLGREVGDLVRQVHEEHGVVFHLGTTPASFDRSRVTLQSGEQLEADFVVVGIGVRPETALGAGRHRGRSRRWGRLVSRDQHSRHLGRRRHRKMARPADRRDDPHRALGRRRTARPSGRTQHARRARTVRLSAVLLDAATRFVAFLRRARREMGPRRDRR